MILICISCYSTACSHYRHTEDMKIVVIIVMMMMMMIIIIIILLLLWFVFFLRSSSLTLCNSYSIAFTLLNCKWSLSSIMPSDSDPTFSDNGPHKEQSWYPHAHGNKKTTSPILNDISWYILISIRNSYSKISSLSKQRLKKNKKIKTSCLQIFTPYFLQVLAASHPANWMASRGSVVGAICFFNVLEICKPWI